MNLRINGWEISSREIAYQDYSQQDERTAIGGRFCETEEDTTVNKDSPDHE